MRRQAQGGDHDDWPEAAELILRMQISARGVAWAARRLEPWAHQEYEGEWSPHMHLTHFIGNETIFQARASEMLDGSEPEFERWDSPAWAAAHQDRSISLTDLGSRFVDEREKTARIFEGLRPEQWALTATWPDGTVIDLAWLGEKVLWHGLEHLAYLLEVHGEWEPRQAGR